LSRRGLQLLRHMLIELDERLNLQLAAIVADAELQRLRAELKVPAQDDPASVSPKQGAGGKKKGGAKKN
jgi:hypothetical protein